MLEKEGVSSPSAKAQLPRFVLYQKKVQDSYPNKDHGCRDREVVKSLFEASLGTKDVSFAAKSRS